MRSMSMCALPEAEGSATAVQPAPVQVLVNGTSNDAPLKPDQRYSRSAFRPYPIINSTPPPTVPPVNVLSTLPDPARVSTAPCGVKLFGIARFVYVIAEE